MEKQEIRHYSVENAGNTYQRLFKTFCGRSVMAIALTQNPKYVTCKSCRRDCERFFVDR